MACIRTKRFSGRPGHARKVQAICAWLNKKHGRGKLVAWAKQDPVRTDLDVPSTVRTLFERYKQVFDRYGRVLYAIYAPTDDREATLEALTAFFDLMFLERGSDVLASAKQEWMTIRTEWYRHLMPNVSSDEVHGLLKARRYVVIEGPPGTGKTRMAREELLEKAYGGNGKTVQFHPNTTYENFVGGLAPVRTSESIGLSFAPVAGHLMQAAAEAAKNPEKDYLLHIDEINRADLGKVLGEAIYLFEPDAEREVDLPYEFDDPFRTKLSLPSNLHVIGTMNTADRSLAIVDVAIRRRFAFTKLWPQVEVVEQYGGGLMRDAFVGLVEIFIDHAGDDAIDLVPGHSYFLEKDDEVAKRRLRVTLVPLLEEYLAQGYVAGFSEHVRSYLQWIDSI